MDNDYLHTIPTAYNPIGYEYISNNNNQLKNKIQIAHMALRKDIDCFQWALNTLCISFTAFILAKLIYLFDMMILN